MCGIAGLAHSIPHRRRETLSEILAPLSHRGPDDAGEWWSDDGRVGLGHRRLAIIDLSPAGHQPMHDASGRLAIVLNGEIYNYRELRRELLGKGHVFRTASDTEVILVAYLEWGDACLERLDGMFAFALYDTAQQRLLIARDRVGEKPLYYRSVPGGLAFASELKALMADRTFDRSLNVEALDYYLTYGYVPGTLSILDGVTKLPAAHSLVWRTTTGELSIRRYWTLPQTAPDPRGDAYELSERLETLLEASVRRQLVADVPVGVMLSGGVDSSLVVAMAARASSTPVKTFNVSFPGHARFDEAPFAREIARHFGTDHIELRADEAPTDLLPLLARQFDEPLADSALVPTAMISALIRNHATVALTGDGGDELFGGYPHYQWMMKAERIRGRVPLWVRRGVSGAARLLPPGTRGRNHLIGFDQDTRGGIAHLNVYFDRAARERLIVPSMSDGTGRCTPEEYRAGHCTPGASVLRQATEADFQTTLADGYLVKVDRASMLHGLELRAPWLDHHIVEFAFGEVPDRLRTTRDELKVLPKMLARRLLPPGFDIRRKQGFTMPLAAWFAGAWGRQAEAILKEAPASLFNPREISRLLRAQRMGFDNTQRLFALTMFELWRREYRIAA
ncbi:MAG: asparagine synthase (glutamine-hydrolyzing) [Acidobacteriota bacterium]|nr:asparagine synthase (glutamine-hydrolyzing) [Acidobacteriota bacterium]MDQ3420374.1 asparagine synthase (glutamine-hydrolyzing) [Acidobacteriota bacterium]